MAQRASIALALARGSRFLLADEPTTGLDPTVQDAILGELFALQDQGLGILCITHALRLFPLPRPLSVARAPADRLKVINATDGADTLYDILRKPKFRPVREQQHHGKMCAGRVP